MITILGTAHGFIPGLRRRVRNLILRIKPDAVCLELDVDRYKGLLKPSMMMSIIMSLVNYGDDMLGAIEGARMVNADVYFIDQPISKTLSELSNALRLEASLPEILRKVVTVARRPSNLPKMLLSIANPIGLFIRDFEGNLSAYRDVLDEVFPFLKRVLIDNREVYMASRIRELSGIYNNMVVVTGAAHVLGLKRLLKDLDVRCESLFNS